MRSAHAEVYRDIRGTGSITACHTVILHEFNGYACRYRRRVVPGGGRSSFILHSISRRDRDLPLSWSILEAAATEINKRAAKEPFQRRAISISRRVQKGNIRRNLIHFPPRTAPLSLSLTSSLVSRAALHAASLIEASPIPSWNWFPSHLSIIFSGTIARPRTRRIITKLCRNTSEASSALYTACIVCEERSTCIVASQTSVQHMRVHYHHCRIVAAAFTSGNFVITGMQTVFTTL